MNLITRKTEENRHGVSEEIRLNEKIVIYIECPLENLNKSMYYIIILYNIFVWIITFTVISCTKIHLIFFPG